MKMLKVISSSTAEAPKMDENKAKALAAALSQIEKQFGKGSIMKMGDAEVDRAIQVVSTGSLGLDMALGVGGLPRGRVVEIYGPESSGKTTLTLQVIANVQKLGGTAAFIDAEHALDPQYAQRLGVDTSELLLSQPDNGEQALEIADMLVRSASVDCVVIDSVAALTPKAEIEGEMGEPQMGLQARLMSQALRKLTANIKRSNTLVIFINQIRMKIGVMFGNPETTTGGNALKFYASVRIDIRRIGSIKRGEEVIGNETRVKVVKNKVAPPFKTADFDILYNEGISREGEIIELGVLHRIVEKVRRLVRLRRREDRPGQGQHPRIPQGEPRDRARDRGEDPRGRGDCGRDAALGRSRRSRLTPHSSHGPAISFPGFPGPFSSRPPRAFARRACPQARTACGGRRGCRCAARGTRREGLAFGGSVCRAGDPVEGAAVRSRQDRAPAPLERAWMTRPSPRACGQPGRTECRASRRSGIVASARCRPMRARRRARRGSCRRAASQWNTSFVSWRNERRTHELPHPERAFDPAGDRDLHPQHAAGEMTALAAKAARLQALHAGPGAFVIANAWDAGSARVLAGLGFEALATSSGAAANTLGRFDGRITREESLAHAKAVVDATELPVSADLEKCFADAPDEAAETIRLAAGVGLAGGSIEDATGDKKQPRYEFEAAVARVAAAARVARSLGDPFVLTARTENFINGFPDLEDTIRRLQAFERAGADVLMAPGLPDLESIRAVCKALTKPFSFMAGIPGKSFSVAELEAAGCAAHQPRDIAL
jgi:recombination protein RecA